MEHLAAIVPAAVVPLAVQGGAGEIAYTPNPGLVQRWVYSSKIVGNGMADLKLL